MLGRKIKLNLNLRKIQVSQRFACELQAESLPVVVELSRGWPTPKIVSITTDNGCGSNKCRRWGKTRANVFGGGGGFPNLAEPIWQDASILWVIRNVPLTLCAPHSSRLWFGATG